MLISFIGAPCSGKTTTAACLFAELKDMGYVSEFVPELARLYIARKRRKLAGEPLQLFDEDQMKIMSLQREFEETMNQPDTLVVTDSSVVNTLLYLSDEVRNSETILSQSQDISTRYNLVFRCPPVFASTLNDPNRVHSYQESVNLDKKLTQIVAQVGIKPILLEGDTRHRTNLALHHVLELLCQG